MVSVIIINYNTFQLTVDCIKSVIEKTVCEYEIILVDNASTECDPQGFKKLFPSIKLVVNTLNYGFAKGNNKGVEVATGDYILLLNSDTLLINNAIDKAYDKIRFDNRIGALSVQLVSTDGTLQQCSHYWSNLPQLIGCTLKLHHVFKYLKNAQPDLKTEHYSDYLYGTFFLLPKKVLDIFSDRKLPETFFMYGEDTEWSYYIKKAGYKLYYYPEAKILHYGGASSNTPSRWTDGFEKDYKLHLIIKKKLYTVIYHLFLSLFYFSHFKKESFATGTYILKFITKKALKKSEPF